MPGHPFETGFDLTLRPERLRQPFGWKRSRMIFVNSMSDLFHKDIPRSHIDAVFDTMERADWHTYQVLTKRSSLLQKFVNRRYKDHPAPKHIWLGVSVENEQATSRVAHLRASRAGIRFLSIEPLLAPVGKLSLDGIHWVIVGGESGPRARPMKPEWAIDIRNQCLRPGPVLLQAMGRAVAEISRAPARRQGVESVSSPACRRFNPASPPGRPVTTTAPFEFDEIGYWSELKLEIVEDYGAAYTKAFANQSLKKYYIDAFSGAGLHRSKRTGQYVEGSPARALNIRPPFDHFYFIDMNPSKTAHLAQLCENRTDVDIVTDDATTYLTRTLLPTIFFEQYNRALCLLDPYGLHLDWEAIQMAGQSRAIDMFLNFPVMDMNRNAIWRDPGSVPQAGIERMTRFWGDTSWTAAAYAENPQTDLFSPLAFSNKATTRS